MARRGRCVRTRGPAFRWTARRRRAAAQPAQHARFVGDLPDDPEQARHYRPAEPTDTPYADDQSQFETEPTQPDEAERPAARREQS